ncbi:hypothetical protein ACFSTH_08245 [Paenibacillus yanchengensis]|uniref:Uncharacterized protein n=1 Tax=Paenibacillus yanchengensis TaxID=2035833 RepID=A0ABW4YKV4_9BACL
MSNGKSVELVTDKIDLLENQIKRYLNLKEGIFDNEYLEIAGDTVQFIGAVKKISSLIMQKRFESFLKGFDNEDPNVDQIERLIKYVNNERKAEFLSDTLSKIMLARSTKACVIMGTLFSSLIDDKANISHIDLIGLQALSQFFDDDIVNYVFICRYIQMKGENKYTVLWGSKFIQALNNEGLEEESVMLTIEKSVSNQLLSKINDVELSIDDDHPSFSSSAEVEENFKITKPGEVLNKYILKSGLN